MVVSLDSCWIQDGRSSPFLYPLLVTSLVAHDGSQAAPKSLNSVKYEFLIPLHCFLSCSSVFGMKPFIHTQAHGQCGLYPL